jgi:hypothetical protein
MHENASVEDATALANPRRLGTTRSSAPDLRSSASGFLTHLLETGTTAAEETK